MNTNSSRTNLTILLLSIILFLSIGIFLPISNNPAQSIDALSVCPTAASDSMNFQNQYGLYYYLNTSESMVIENISERLVAEQNANPDKITITSCTSTQISMVDVPNISQDELNQAYGEAHDRTITGTCTLVAIEEIMEAMISMSDEQYSFTETRDERFANLIDIFERYGTNDYTQYEDFGGSSGTNIPSTGYNLQSFLMPYYNNYYIPIRFWEDYGHYNAVDKINTYSTISSLDATHVLPLSFIITYNFDKSKMHTMAIAGAYKVSVNYKYKTKSGWNWLFSKSGSEDYTILVVCNGWHTNDGGNFYINGNYQYLVLDYNIPFYIVGFNWYDFVPGVNY